MEPGSLETVVNNAFRPAFEYVFGGLFVVVAIFYWKDLKGSVKWHRDESEKTVNSIKQLLESLSDVVAKHTKEEGSFHKKQEKIMTEIMKELDRLNSLHEETKETRDPKRRR